MTSVRTRLLPDRTAKVEAALYVLGPGLATFGLVLTLVFAPTSAPPAGVGARTITVVVGLLLVAIALARRSRPASTSVLVLAGGALTAGTAVITGMLDPSAMSGSYLASMVLFTVAVRRCRPRVAVLSGLLAVITYVVSSVARSGSVQAAAEMLGADAPPRATVSEATGWLVALLVGLLLRSGDASRRVEALARVRASERLLVARELHDLVARHVTGMVVRAQSVAVVVRDLPEPARSALEDIETSGNDALAAMRRMVGVLRSTDAVGTDGDLAGLDDLPSAAVDVESAVRGAVDEAGPTRVPVRIDVDDSVRTGSAPARELLTTVHRLVAEGLTNVARHAPAATAVEVAVTRTGDDLVLTVANDGAAGATRQGPEQGGFGLVGMAERARALGGTLDGRRDGGDRWVLTARVPVHDPVAARPPA